MSLKKASSQGACSATTMPSNSASQRVGGAHLTIAIRMSNVKATLMASPRKKASTKLRAGCPFVARRRHAKNALGMMQATPPSKMSRRPARLQNTMPNAAITTTSTICRLRAFSMMCGYVLYGGFRQYASLRRFEIMPA
ncbi:MAG: hypothetical protein Q4A16_00605 [Lautropia sp.]|nr:hypothetical protein [Lautropia sp.]